MTPCPICTRLGKLCTTHQAEHDRQQRPALRGHVNPLSRLERDQLPPVPAKNGIEQLTAGVDALLAWEEADRG
jgi:hypothetical protein